MAGTRQTERRMASITGKMLVLSLVVAAIAGGIGMAVADSVVMVAISVLVALISAMLCSGVSRSAIGALRREQLAILSEIMPIEALAPMQSEHDDLIALTAGFKVVVGSQNDSSDRQSLLDLIYTAERKLKIIMHSWSTSDEKEVAQVRDAVSAMENLNSAFALVISEIDELSGRTEERASISAEMSATTDAIADNINQYSNFVIETSSSIEEMACAIRETADNIRALAVSTEQTVASISLISQSQATVRDNSERSAAASENVRTLAQQGLRSMVATLKAMHEIEKSNDESFDSINRLSRHSARVGEFLNVIQEVVEQTNLLSLNASIIAAQAGNRGKAFAVVAEEVRSLAHRTSASTKEIEELVRNIQKETATVQRSVTQGKGKVKEGVKISSMANDALVTIEKSAEEASRMVARIAGETNEQSSGIQRITEESEKNLERVQQITITTEHQQEGTNQIVNNLEHMRELAHRINSSAQEQARGNRLYLKSVMEDNERTHMLKEEASRQIALAGLAVEAVRQVEALIESNTQESARIVTSLTALTELIDQYRGETILELDNEALTYE